MGGANLALRVIGAGPMRARWEELSSHCGSVRILLSEGSSLEGAAAMIIGGFLLAGLGVGMALGNPGAGALIGLGLGLVFNYLFQEGWISKRKGSDSKD